MKFNQFFKDPVTKYDWVHKDTLMGMVKLEFIFMADMNTTLHLPWQV